MTKANPPGTPRKPSRKRKSLGRKRVPVNYTPGVKSPEAQAAWDAGPKAWMTYVRSKKTVRGRPPGCPDGYRREEAEAMWAECRKKADWIMSELENEGVLSFPDTPEEQMAKTALHKAFEMVLSPIELKSRLSAIRMVLEWTKAKPATKTDLRMNHAEAWLAQVVADHKAGDV